MKTCEGNLIDLAFQGKFDYILHGCNCFNTMGAGLAREIASRLPAAAHIDGRTPKGAVAKLGNYTMALIRKLDIVFKVVNVYTQYEPGSNFKPAALKVALFKLNKELPIEARIGIPQIGAGIGGGDWGKILQCIQEELPNRRVTIVYYTKQT